MELHSFKRFGLGPLLIAALLTAGCATSTVESAPMGAVGESTQRSIATAAAPPKKVIIFYSTIGMGHLSAARSIEKNLKARDSGVEVVLKDIRDFAPKLRDKIEEKAFWYIVKNHPNTFDALYRSAMLKGNIVPNLSQAPQMYNAEKVRAFIQSEGADVVLTTHYGSAQVVGDLRDAGQLDGVRTGWLHTDYVEGYFPRISKRVDMSFLPHKGLEEIWRRAGVDESKFVTTGMPLNPSLFKPVDREAFMVAKGLDPNVRTVVLASGGEGVGDFPAIVKSIAKEVSGPFQIVAVCAKNEKHVKNLNALKASLPSNIRLDVLGFTPSDDLLNYIKISDVYITKSGGLSPTEGFAIMKPMLLLDVYGGHEHDNLLFFEDLKMATGIKNQRETGKDVVALLNDPARQEQMLDAQAKFRQALDIEKVTEFVFTGQNTFRATPRDFGREGGSEVKGTREQLERLAKDSPADMEIMLSYAKNQKNVAIDMTENPFGHIAIRVGDDVYTLNHLAVPGQDRQLLAKVSLDEYLFSTKPYDVHIEEASTTGLAYARDTIGIRVNGLTAEQKQAMIAKIAEIESQWQAGTYRYIAKTNNCADTTDQILRAGGFAVERKFGPVGKFARITMPLDLFDWHLSALQRNRKLDVEIVNYTRIPDSLSKYKFSRFPVSIYQIRRSVSNLLKPGRPDKLELLNSKRVTAYAGDPTLHYENLNGRSGAEDAERKATLEREYLKRREDLRSEETALETAKRQASEARITSSDLQRELGEFLDEVSPTDRRKIGTELERELSDAHRKRLAEIRSRMARVDATLASHQSALDKLVVGELDLLADEAVETAQWAMVSLQKRYGMTNTKAFMKSLLAIELKNKEFRQAKALYGQPKDQVRLSAYRDLMDELKKFHRQVDAMYDGEKVVGERNFLRTIANRIANVFRKIRQFAALSPDIFRTLRVVLTPVRIERIFANADAEAKSLPLTKAIKKFANKAAKSEGITVEIRGRERIPVLGNKKIINLYAPTHRQAMNDLMIMGQLIPDDALIFAVPEYFAPKSIANALAKKDGFVAVGSGRDPISNAMAQINAGKSQNLLIYPEGSVSVGLQETRPTRTKFYTGLINRLRNEGYTVNIIPIVYGNTATPLTQNGVVSKVLRAEVLAPISDAQVALYSGMDDQALGRQIRGSWLDALPTNEREFEGKLRVDVAYEETMKYLYGVPEWRAPHCRGLLTSP